MDPFGWLVLLTDWFVWATVMPVVGLVLWAVGRLGLLGLRLLGMRSWSVPLWLETPWDVLMHLFIRVHRVRLIDCDSKANGILLPESSSFTGAVLVNHRSWADFMVDPCQAHCAVVARVAAVAVCLLGGALGIACNRVIVIVRGRTSRQQLMQKTSAHDRFIMYPEGTRRATAADADEPAPLRVGGLKNLYEAQTPALIVITVNKERIFNEKRGHVSFSTELYRARHAPILPADFDTFDAFHAAIEEAWQRTWRLAYALRATHEGNGLAEFDPSLVSLNGDDESYC